jgi:TolA-binding protein
MSSKPLMLEGRVDEREQQISALHREIDRLERELLEVQNQRDQAVLDGQQAQRALKALQRQLQPLFSALRMVFGELDAVGIEEEESAPSVASAPPAKKEVWDAWKSRLGGAASKIIDALLTHGELNTQQLSIVTGLHRTTVPNGVSQLNKAGLINKRDGKFSLKAL